MDVFRVLYRDGKPFVAQRELISKSGSWVTLRCGDGTIVKENGHDNWSETILYAIQKEAEFILHRYSMPGIFKQAQQVESMDALIVEAMEFGKLLGEINGHGRKMASDNSEQTERHSSNRPRIRTDE